MKNNEDNVNYSKSNLKKYLFDENEGIYFLLRDGKEEKLPSCEYLILYARNVRESLNKFKDSEFIPKEIFNEYIYLYEVICSLDDYTESDWATGTAMVLRNELTADLIEE